MKFFYDLFPLLLFFAAFKMYGIYTATAVAIAASFLQVGVHYLRHRRFETTHLVTLGVITVFGGLTLALRDDTFIKWKPTIVYWLLGGAVIASQWIGEKPFIERMLSAQLQAPRHVWLQQNLTWGLFFLILGVLNLYVAFYYGLDLDTEARQEIWVNFKVFGLTGLTLLFVVVQAFLLSRHVTPDDEKTSQDN